MLHLSIRKARAPREGPRVRLRGHSQLPDFESRLHNNIKHQCISSPLVRFARQCTRMGDLVDVASKLLVKFAQHNYPLSPLWRHTRRFFRSMNWLNELGRPSVALAHIERTLRPEGIAPWESFLIRPFFFAPLLSRSVPSLLSVSNPFSGLVERIWRQQPLRDLFRFRPPPPPVPPGFCIQPSTDLCSKMAFKIRWLQLLIFPSPLARVPTELCLEILVGRDQSRERESEWCA